jgi:hypothetical protein
VRVDDAIAMKRRVSRETWDAEMLCRRPSVRGAVFPTFDPSVHVREDLEPRGTMWLGIDFGFNAPFACLWVAKDESGVVRVVDEYVCEQRLLAEHVEEIGRRRWGKVDRVACDPAGNARNDQTAVSDVRVLKDARYAVKSTKSRIADGLERIRSALRSAAGEVRLFVHPRCKHLIEAMKAYRYPDGGGETPIKDGVHDHPIDALRYFFVNSQGSGEVKETRY